MCLNPISIINPSKYVSLSYKDRYLLQVPCGSCAECQSSYSNQWNYRTFYEFTDCLRAGGFVYFDSLSYDDKNLPRINSVLPDFDFKENFSCFRKKDITDFLKRLRVRAYRDYRVNLRYFLSTEYGHDNYYRDKRGRLRKGTNRPHYHVLFFVYGNISPLDFSKLVSSCWTYGLTDGFPYKPSSYVYSHNTINVNLPETILRTSNYISKYVQKSCEFKATIDKRISLIMFRYAEKFSPNNIDVWLSSTHASRIRRVLNSVVTQFHRQSLHYGESALSDLDLSQLFHDGYLVMPHFRNVKVKVALPTYYKRKLFYRLVEIDGSKSWQLNDLGIEYRAKREKYLLADTQSRFQAVCIQHHLDFDCKTLAEYVFYDRGRIRASIPSPDIETKIGQVDLFNYVTLTDKENLMVRGLTPSWCGNSVQGYNTILPPMISIRDFISKYVILDNVLESQLSTIYHYLSYADKGKQDAYVLKQRLKNVFKCFV